MRGYVSFVAACITLIAASTGAILHFAAGLSVVESALIALTVLFALMTFEVTAARNRDRMEFTERFEGLARASADIARGVGDLRHRVAALELAPTPDPKAAIEPLAREIADLAQVVEELAETVAMHDTKLDTTHAAAFDGAPSNGDGPDGKEPSPLEFVRLVGAEKSSAAGGNGGRTSGEHADKDEKRKTQLRAALEAGRTELFLQPVVTLPQRKVRYYEALSRLRLADDTIVEAREFILVARDAGLLPKVDERLVRNCVQVVRRLAAKSRDIGLFVNIAPETLADRAVFPEMLGYLEANRALAPSIVLELSQAAYGVLGPVQLNSLSLLAQHGFRFSLDRVEDLRFDAPALADRGVRFVKVSGERMLRHVRNGGTHIHAADLSGLLSRHGIGLVVDRVESESVVVDLLDHDVGYAQGNLFAPPRPIRNDILNGERVAGTPVETTPAPSPARGGLSELARAVQRA